MGSLDTSVVKLPRVWMDGTRPYELPPRDTRRWSYVSEPIRYIDEYVRLFVYLLVCLFACLFVCLFVCLLSVFVCL